MAVPVAVLRGTTGPNGVVYQFACRRAEDAPAKLAAWRAIRVPVEAFVKLEWVHVDQDVNEDKSAPVPLDPKTGLPLPAGKPEDAK